jgi:hypothetical protein
MREGVEERERRFGEGVGLTGGPHQGWWRRRNRPRAARGRDAGGLGRAVVPSGAGRAATLAGPRAPAGPRQLGRAGGVGKRGMPRQGGQLGRGGRGGAG